MKKWTAALLPLLLVLLIVLGVCLSTCTPSDPGDSNPSASESTAPSDGPSTPAGQVRILNTDPLQQEAWEALADEYRQETGVPVEILTDTADAQPTLLNISDPEDLPENCVDLSHTGAYAQLASLELALEDGQGRVTAVASEIEVFGLVYNSTLLAQTGHTRADIGSFTQLTEVVYGITDQKQSYGFSAFARIDPQEHFALKLASLPAGCRNLLDLILHNTPCDPVTLAEGTKNDALHDFLEGKAVFFLAGSGEQETLNAIGSENMGVLPVYMGGENEENQSLCVAATGYWCIDADASKADVKATVAFLNFLTGVREDGTVPADDLQRMAPYRQAAYASNILESVLRYDLAMGKKPVICRRVEQVPQGLADAIIAYAQDPSDLNWAAILTLTEN